MYLCTQKPKERKTMEEAKYKSNARILHILLVISFVVSGYNLLSYLLMGLTLPTMRELMPNMIATMPEKYQAATLMVEKMLELPQWYFLVVALLNAVSVLGLILMWKLKKNGFHCYTLSKLVLMALPMMFLDRSFVSIGDMMLAVLFIVYYFFLLKVLGAFDNKNGVIVEESVDNTDNREEDTSEETEK